MLLFLISTFTIIVKCNSISVMDYNAVPGPCDSSNKEDNTNAFQTALDQASSNNDVSIVTVPRGCFRFIGHINVPRGITLQGSFSAVPSHPDKNLNDELVLVRSISICLVITLLIICPLDILYCSL